MLTKTSILFCSMLAFMLLFIATADVSINNQLMSSKDSSFGRCKSSVFPISRSLEKMMKIRGGSSSVVHVASAAEFDQLVSESDGKLIVVDFSAAWCGPCKIIAPMFEEMSNPAGEFASVIFVKIDVDEVPELAERFQVQAMPTFLFMKGTGEVDRFSGASVEKLRQTIMTHFK